VRLTIIDVYDLKTVPRAQTLDKQSRSDRDIIQHFGRQQQFPAPDAIQPEIGQTIRPGQSPHDQRRSAIISPLISKRPHGARIPFPLKYQRPRMMRDLHHQRR